MPNAYVQTHPLFFHITERGDKTASALLFTCAEHLLAVHDISAPRAGGGFTMHPFFEEFYMPDPAVFVRTLSFFSKFHSIIFSNLLQGRVLL